MTVDVVCVSKYVVFFTNYHCIIDLESVNKHNIISSLLTVFRRKKKLKINEKQLVFKNKVATAKSGSSSKNTYMKLYMYNSFLQILAQVILLQLLVHRVNFRP